MYVIALNQFLDPAIVWLDEPPDPATPHAPGQHLLVLRTYEEARDIVVRPLERGRHRRRHGKE